MAYSSLGAKRQPQFADGDAPDVAVNPSQVSNYAADFGNYKVDTAAARTSAASWAWEGLLWRDTDSNKVLWKFTSGAWKAWESDWITYIPTIGNLTVGNGTLSAHYGFRDGVCLCEGKFTFGSTSAISASPRLTHPVTADAISGSDNFPLGLVTFLDAGVAAYMGFVQGVNTTTADIRTSLASGTYTTPGGLSSTVPFTFGASDLIMWRYEFGPA